MRCLGVYTTAMRPINEAHTPPGRVLPVRHLFRRFDPAEQPPQRQVIGNFDSATHEEGRAGPSAVHSAVPTDGPAASPALRVTVVALAMAVCSSGATTAMV